MDSSIENAFITTRGDKRIKFELTPEGLYGYKPSQEYLETVEEQKFKDEKSHFVSTVKANMEGFTKREVEGAMRARKLYHSIGCPSVENMKNEVLRLDNVIMSERQDGSKCAWLLIIIIIIKRKSLSRR